MENISTPESVCVDFSVSSIPGSFTRADNENYDGLWNEEGSYLENYIDIANNDFHIAFFTQAGDFIAEFDGSEIINKTENNVSATHSMIIEFRDEKLEALPKNFIDEEFKVMIIANWKAYAGQDSYESFSNKEINQEKPANVWIDKGFYNFRYSTDSGNSWTPTLSNNSKRLIPMAGYAEFKGFIISPLTGKLTASVTVKMVRALAKITLSLNENLWESGFRIESCTLNRHVPQGKAIPDMTLEGNDFGENGSIRIESPSDFGNLESVPLSFVNTGEEGSNPVLTAYVPEIDTSGFTTSDGNRPYLSVKLTLNGKEFIDKNVELNDNDLSSASLFHIIRNHHYDYIIDDITGDQEISLKYTVCPWGEGDVDIDFH